MNESVAAIRDAFSNAAHQLDEAQAKDELLARLTPRRKLLGLARPPVMVPVGRVWRLGVFLVGRDLTIYATGSITRVTDTGRPTFQSSSVEERREYRATAMRSGLPKGETVNFDAAVIELDAAALSTATGPLFLRDDEPFVRWSHAPGSGSTMPLDSYIRDRTELLVNPPEGT